ncbi:hypothetical protein Tco_1055648 [Tanacetum coccineum]|uniref:Uncharacterized protein n=1 Tax=Tanacetum coccineum TaxID=301880 RepID=A0ABQ5H090_9ASTR
MRDFLKTHPSGSGTVTKTAPSVAKIKPSVTNERTGVKPGVPDVTEEESSEKNDSDDDKTQSNNENESDSKHETDENESGFESDQDENEEDIGDDDEEVKDESVKTLSNDSHNEDETKITDKAKDDPLKTQVTALVDHLDARLGATRDEFRNYLSASITAKFELKKILIDKMDKSESYLAAPEHRECYKGLIKSYDLDKTIFSTYGKVYSLNKNRKDKDKDEDPSAGSDRGLKKRKTSKDAEPIKGPKAKESQSSLSKGTKSQQKSSGKYVQSKEPEFDVADSYMPQDQEGNLGNDDDEPMKETISKRDWFTKPTQPQEPTDPD